LQEAWEEAGLRGRILGEALGNEKAGVLLTVEAYLMEVDIGNGTVGGTRTPWSALGAGSRRSTDARDPPGTARH